ncbi:uncharacterized protein CBL_10436 [Carabus blaptoides fortunei]
MSRSSLPDILDDEEDATLEHWKPSVYWVMFSLTLASCIIASIAAAVYAPFEKWTYFEALYFCFVSFATIGFGDYVSTQELSYPNVYLYRIGNFFFLVLGCCCIYSLLNVTSIVIKQVLNWLILQLQCRCKDDPMSATGRLWRRHSAAFQHSRRNKRRRSSAAYPHNARKIRRHGMMNSWKKPAEQNGEMKKDEESDSAGYDSDGDRRLSGELISMKDFLKANKVSLAVMQKQLYETAQMQRGGISGYVSGRDGEVYQVGGGIHVIPNRRPASSSFTPGTVGPLAIVSEKLGDTVPPR